SIKPGVTTRPLASITLRPSRALEVIALITPAEMPTLRTASSRVSGSITRPLRITTSYTSFALELKSGDALRTASNEHTITALHNRLFVITVPSLDQQLPRLFLLDHLARHKSDRAC